jgi:hypothetical protein
VTLTPRLLVLFVGGDAEGFQVGDVGVVVVGDGRNHHRVAQQVGTADLLDAAQLFTFDGAELGKVHLGPWDQAQLGTATTRRGLGHSRSHRRRNGRGLDGARHDTACERLHVIWRDAALVAGTFDFSQRHTQLAGELAHRGRCVGQPSSQSGRVVGGHRHSSRGGHGCGSRCNGGSGSSNRCRRSSSAGRGGWRSGTRSTFQYGQQVADVDGVAQLDLQLFDDASVGRRDFHRRFVALHGDQALLHLHGVANLHKHLDDGHVFEVTDVRYVHKHGRSACHGSKGLAFGLGGAHKSCSCRCRWSKRWSHI